jgi:uncharacterized membrane protein YdjX (TVP38/TMEM64 family)
VALRRLAFAAIVLGAILIPYLLLEDWLLGTGAALLDAMRGRPLQGGLIIIALLAGDVLLPIPSSVISVFAGSAFGLAWGAAVIWAGLMAGCLLGYALGAVPGRGLANRVVGRRDVAGMGRLFEGAGPVVLVLARAVPVLAEASVLAAGAARMPLATFLLTTGLSNIGVALAYAGVGATAAATGSFLLAFIGMCSVPALGWLAWSRLKRRNNNTRNKGNEAE